MNVRNVLSVPSAICIVLVQFGSNQRVICIIGDEVACVHSKCFLFRTMALKALVGHHVDRQLKVAINFNKRRKFIKIAVSDELSEDEFEEIYQEFAFGQYELKDVYATFNAAMEIGTPNVFKVLVEDAVCKIIIAKEKDMELEPFVLRPTSGPAVEQYQENLNTYLEIVHFQTMTSLCFLPVLSCGIVDNLIFEAKR